MVRSAATSYRVVIAPVCGTKPSERAPIPSRSATRSGRTPHRSDDTRTCAIALHARLGGAPHRFRMPVFWFESAAECACRQRAPDACRRNCDRVWQGVDPRRVVLPADRGNSSWAGICTTAVRKGGPLDATENTSALLWRGDRFVPHGLRRHAVDRVCEQQLGQRPFHRRQVWAKRNGGLDPRSARPEGTRGANRAPRCRRSRRALEAWACRPARTAGNSRWSRPARSRGPSRPSRTCGAAGTRWTARHSGTAGIIG
jgi:hypothetical protein